MFTREVSTGVWADIENLTIYLDEWNWPTAVTVIMEPFDIPRVFWYQSYHDYMMEPTGDGMYTSFKVGNAWHDDTGVLQGHIGRPLHADTGICGLPGYAWVEKDGVIYRLMLNLFRPTSTTPGPEPGDRLRLSAHPNPFNDRLTVHWCAPRGSNASLELFDIRGRNVAGFLRREGVSGEGAVTWSIGEPCERNLPDGVYFLRLSTGAESRTNRIVRLTRR